MYRKLADEYEAELNNALHYISPEDWYGWKNHPCTKALRLKLSMDETGWFEEWVNDGMEADQAKWLIRYTESLQKLIFEEGLYSEEEEKEDDGDS